MEVYIKRVPKNQTLTIIKLFLSSVSCEKDTMKNIS
jgi:hypothetical protein